MRLAKYIPTRPSQNNGKRLERTRTSCVFASERDNAAAGADFQVADTARGRAYLRPIQLADSRATLPLDGAALTSRDVSQTSLHNARTNNAREAAVRNT